MAHLNIKYNLDLQTTDVDGKRHYITPQGNIYPSMTTILSRYKEPSLQKWKDRVGEVEANKIRDKAANFGTKIHEMCEAYILGKDLPTHNNFHRSRFETLRKVIDERFGDVYALEAALYSDRLKVAGRTDVIGLFDGIPSVIDFKNSNKPKKAEWIHDYFHQGAGYSFMYAERTGDRETIPRQIVIVVSVEHEIEPQVFIQPVARWIKPMEDVISKFS